MAYLGINPNTPLLNTSTEFFSGNSAATEFTLNRAVASASDLDVMIGNVMQRPFLDYTAGNTTLLFENAPGTGSNNVTVTYRAGALNSLDLTASVFNTGTEGNPSVYSLAGDNTGLYWANSQSMSVTVQGSDRAVFLGNATSVSATTGALVVSGGIGANGNVNVTGTIVTTNNTESSSLYTGALQIGGGAGIVGNLNVGGDITCVGDFTVNGIFTTTGTDSLEVNDPFIFLANANPGDTYDTGVVSEYYDGANTRYTGYFRDITDNKYKIFGNLLTKPSTTVDTGNASFQYQDLVLANLSATGNVEGAYFVGNGSALTGISTDTTQIVNGTSKVIIPSLSGNITANVTGNTVTTFWASGIAVTGGLTTTTTVSATGNITGANVNTGIVSASGNIVTSSGNVSSGNIITSGLITAVGNATVGNISTAGQASAGGNVTGANLKTTGLISATGDVYGNNFSATTAINAGAGISATTTVLAGTDVSAAGAVNAGTTISAAGNITGANVNTGILSLTGNILGAINTVSNVTTTGNISGGNIFASQLLQGATLSATGVVTFSGTTHAISVGTSQTTGTTTVGGASQTGAINIGRSTASQTLALGNGVTGSGNTKTIGIGELGASGSTTTITIGPTAGAGTGTTTFNTGATVAIANTSSTALSVAGNITGGNISTAGSGGNITGANVVSATTFNGTTVSVTGDVTGANINGGNLLTGGLISATGNVTGGNLIATTAVTAGSGGFSSAGNVTGGNINTPGLISSTGNVTNGIANVLTGNLIATTLVSGATVTGTTLSATGNVIGGNLNAAGLSLSGNVVSGISLTDNIVTTGNITGGNILFGSGIVSGTGNIAGGNVLGGANVNATLLSGTWVSTSGNVTSASVVGGVMTGTSVSVSGTVTAASVVGGIMSGTSVSVSGTVTGAGITGTSLTVSTGNVTLGNIVNGGANLAGNIGSATGYFNTAFIKATSAQYADLAENYAADAGYAPGTVLEFGGKYEVTIAQPNTARVAGVITTNPAHVMNSDLAAEHIASIALTGRVPTSVVGTIRKGDMMVSAGNGLAQACATPALGTVIGKALEDFDGEAGVIEVVVGRL